MADDGRGTDTCVESAGQVIKKPVMGTKDLRFLEHPDAETLPDGTSCRGMSAPDPLAESLVIVMDSMEP